MAHIALIAPSLGGGGAERSVARLAQGFCQRGHRVDVVLFAPAVAYAEELPEAARLLVLCSPALWKGRSVSDVPESTLWQNEQMSLARAARLLPACIRGFGSNTVPDGALRFVIYMLLRRNPRERGRRLLSYVERERPDIIFANLFQTEYAAFFAALLSDPLHFPPIVPVIRGIETLERKQRTHRRRFLRSVPFMVAVSCGVKDNITAIHGICRDRIVTIYNPTFTPDIFARAEEEPDHPWFGEGGSPVILGAGRLNSQKDFATLLDAFQRVSTERPCRLIILGEGPLRREIEDQAESLGLQDCISLPGWVENPFSFMARAALFVLSSRHEGLPGVLIQAIACGCPAVSTDCPAGPSEILKEPNLLAPVGDPDALARVMLRTLAKPVDKAALRSEAARFSMDQAMDRYEEIVDRSLKRRTHAKANDEK